MLHSLITTSSGALWMQHILKTWPDMEVVLVNIADTTNRCAKRLFINTWKSLLLKTHEGPVETPEQREARLADEFRHVFIRLQVSINNMMLRVLLTATREEWPRRVLRTDSLR